MKKLPLSLAIGAMLISPLTLAKTVDAVASFTVLADIVKQVGGDHVKVKSLVGRMAIRTPLSPRRRIVRRWRRPMWCSSAGWAWKAGWTG